MSDALQRLFAQGCRYCRSGWPIDDGDDGIPRGGRYHAQETYTPGVYGGGFVLCEVADERLALTSTDGENR